MPEKGNGERGNEEQGLCPHGKNIGQCEVCNNGETLSKSESEVESAPEGWMTAPVLVQTLGKSQNFIYPRVESYRP